MVLITISACRATTGSVFLSSMSNESKAGVSIVHLMLQQRSFQHHLIVPAVRKLRNAGAGLVRHSGHLLQDAAAFRVSGDNYGSQPDLTTSDICQHRQPLNPDPVQELSGEGHASAVAL